MGSHREENIARRRNLGVALTSDVKIKVNWKTMSESLGAVLAGGFAAAFGVPSGGVTAFSGLVKAFTALEKKVDPSERAWQLLMLCFGWAVGELRAAGVSSPTESKRLAADIVTHAKGTLSKEAHVLPADFFQRPTMAPLYVELREAFIKRKDIFRADISESDESLRARFDAAFTIALFEVWARRSDAFASLLTALDPRISSAAQFQVQWEAYRESLVHAFRVAPVFGQEDKRVSLSQLYVPLRGSWIQGVDEEAETYDGPIDEAARGRHVHIVDIEAELRTWLTSETADHVRVIGGGPGSGKSTTLRSFACWTAEMAEWRPLFIPLQHIDISGDLRANISRYFTDRTNGPFTISPISRQAVEGGPPLVLIFDGLDELSTPGEAAKDVANLFVSKLTQLVSEIRGDADQPVKVILSGRLPSFEAVKRYLNAPGRQSLEVVGYGPVARSSIVSGHDLAKVDQRKDWWTRYSAIFKEQTELPPAFQEKRLFEITNEPLLCYLLVISRFALENWRAAADNQNRIYARLIDDVWQRGWGAGSGEVRRQGPGKSLKKVNFNRLMETIAHAAWLGGDTRSCTEDSFLEAVAINKCEADWLQFKDESGPDVANLAMNFYLRSSERTYRGFEFTHKSFGDYLAARALVNRAFEIAALADGRPDIALQDLFRTTSTGQATDEIVRFVQDEFRLRTRGAPARSRVIAVKDAFVRLAEQVIDAGFPMLAGSDATFRGLEARQRNAEIALWMIMSGAAYALSRSDDTLNCRLQVRWRNKHSLGDLISRLSVGAGSNRVILRCLECISAPGAHLYGARLTHGSFRHANFEGANFALTAAVGVNFAGANLRGASFLRANVSESEFAEADVEGADFTDAFVSGSSLFFTSHGTFRISEISLATHSRLSAKPPVEITTALLSRLKFTSYYNSESLIEYLVRLGELRAASHGQPEVD